MDADVFHEWWNWPESIQNPRKRPLSFEGFLIGNRMKRAATGDAGRGTLFFPGAQGPGRRAVPGKRAECAHGPGLHWVLATGKADRAESVGPYAHARLPIASYPEETRTPWRPCPPVSLSPHVCREHLDSDGSRAGMAHRLCELDRPPLLRHHCLLLGGHGASGAALCLLLLQTGLVLSHDGADLRIVILSTVDGIVERALRMFFRHGWDSSFQMGSSFGVNTRKRHL